MNLSELKQMLEESKVRPTPAFRNVTAEDFTGKTRLTVYTKPLGLCLGGSKPLELVVIQGVEDGEDVLLEVEDDAHIELWDYLPYSKCYPTAEDAINAAAFGVEKHRAARAYTLFQKASAKYVEDLLGESNADTCDVRDTRPTDILVRPMVVLGLLD
jgi:hypothetical protein